MRLVQKIIGSQIDIIGDVHGEYDALVNLLAQLGYNLNGNHNSNRKLVFVGDLIDRGPDSPAVIKLVKKLVESGNAQAILGNHELNILKNDAKAGAGWFFEERTLKDKIYEPFARAFDAEKKEIFNFISTLPLALENDSLRIVHATWDSQLIEKVKKYKLNDVANLYRKFENNVDEELERNGILSAYKKESKMWDVEDPNAKIPFLEATSAYNIAHQMNNPFRVLTSGVEKRAVKSFYTSGKWRFVERFSWWDEYNEEIPVVVGHFWRRWNNKKVKANEENVFEEIEPTSWHGSNNNVFCVDFSVGGRYQERPNNIGYNTKLAALQWPENRLVLESGEVVPTINYMSKKKKLVI